MWLLNEHHLLLACLLSLSLLIVIMAATNFLDASRDGGEKHTKEANNYHADTPALEEVDAIAVLILIIIVLCIVLVAIAEVDVGWDASQQDSGQEEARVHEVQDYSETAVVERFEHFAKWVK